MLGEQFLQQTWEFFRLSYVLPIINSTYKRSSKSPCCWSTRIPGQNLWNRRKHPQPAIQRNLRCQAVQLLEWNSNRVRAWLQEPQKSDTSVDVHSCHWIHSNRKQQDRIQCQQWFPEDIEHNSYNQAGKEIIWVPHRLGSCGDPTDGEDLQCLWQQRELNLRNNRLKSQPNIML